MPATQTQLAAQRDQYRFGSGARPCLQPGTMGWTVHDLEDPQIRALWDDGAYEIIDGVLTVMPPAYFRGGKVADNLKYILRGYFAARKTRAVFSGEVDIAVRPPLVVRADGVVIVGDDLPKFESLRFDPPRTTWEDHALTLPPTIIIESVSEGHEAHDRTRKRAWYAQFKVPHYWIVDGLGRTLECLRLNGDHYDAEAFGRDDDVLTPPSFPGLSIALPEVWEQ
jgi:Uma2 family endonuclease